MKITKLNNAVEVSDIDLHNDDECIELGKLVAQECVVFVNDSVSEDRLYDIHSNWGDMSSPPVLKYAMQNKPEDEHWSFVHKMNKNITDKMNSSRSGIARISFEKTDDGEPTGAFPNGKLGWHCDQQALYETQRVIGLMSLYGSENSQTSFLCTAEMYDKLNKEDKTMIDELVCVSAWDGEMARGLDTKQLEVLRYHMVPMDGIEQPLKQETATGVNGIKYPSHSFSHFKGMSKEDSLKYRDHLWSLLNKPEYIYTHDWKDGQIMFMDQNITLHARPTNIEDGDNRTMLRCISHVNKLFKNQDPLGYVTIDGRKISHNEFAEMANEQRLRDFDRERL